MLLFAEHDVDVGDTTPIKQAPYRANPTKQKNLEKEIDCESAFNQAKALLSTNPVLMAPDFNQPFSMMVDASDVGAGAVLTQADAEGIDRPISFFSKKFSASQKNYSTGKRNIGFDTCT